MQDLIKFLVSTIVNHESDIEISEEKITSEQGREAVLYQIKVHPDDMGILIGKSGHTIQSVRTIAKIKAIKEGKYIDIRVVDNKQTSEEEK
ncbi:hypothetical protein A2982_02345 [candidate division WWE3 bacterium RIFCSPLOWO2_01_FULL_39_13]|uniref:Uncharacterized protein n=1 Tax=candidate division WWE3 bacterium RIFCSPLOWO2_01_FULL_39_13 TaxID=1802624 RepID=A0A1F4V1J0_UNCKA|nr:MAG: hypothetical protein A2982_02345 [candidate division WWE3 bacterium RIFCSPLOWO2_01_FULL_39_13]